MILIANNCMLCVATSQLLAFHNTGCKATYPVIFSTMYSFIRAQYRLSSKW